MVPSRVKTRRGLVAAGLINALCLLNFPQWVQVAPVAFNEQSIQNGRWSDPISR